MTGPAVRRGARPSVGLGPAMAVGVQRHSEASGPSAKRPARPPLGCPARGPGCRGDLHSSGLVQPLLWPSPGLGRGLQPPPAAVPAPQRGRRRACPSLWPCGCQTCAGCWLVPPRWKPLMLLVTRGASPVPWPVSTRSSKHPVGRWLAGGLCWWPSWQGQRGGSGQLWAEAQSHVRVRFHVGAARTTSHQPQPQAGPVPAPRARLVWVDCSGLPRFVCLCVCSDGDRAAGDHVCDGTCSCQPARVCVRSRDPASG